MTGIGTQAPDMEAMSDWPARSITSAAAQAHLHEDGYLLLRGAVPADVGRPVREELASLLVAWGVAEGPDLAWSGRPVPHLDRIAMEDIPSVSALSAALAAGTEPSIARLGRVLLGANARAAARVHVYCSVPDDPAYCSPPHQDDYGSGGEPCYRVWLPLTPIAAGEGSLAVARGSHRGGRLQPAPQHSYRVRRLRPGASSRPPLALEWDAPTGFWCTAGFELGDAVVMHPDVVHAALPHTDARIRLAMACDVSLSELNTVAETPWPRRT